MKDINHNSKAKLVYRKHANDDEITKSESESLTDPDIALFLKRARLQSIGEERLSPVTFNRPNQDEKVNKLVDFSDVYFVGKSSFI